MFPVQCISQQHVESPLVALQVYYADLRPNPNYYKIYTFPSKLTALGIWHNSEFKKNKTTPGVYTCILYRPSIPSKT